MSGPARSLTGFLVTAATAGILAACTRPIFDRAKPSVERVSPSIPGSRFRVLAPIAGGDALTDLQISATVRQQLQDSGVTVVRRAGRWESQTDAVRVICAPEETPSIDGVLFIWYNRLELRDCGSGGTAYEITSQGAEGITKMTDRLIRYLKQPATNPASSP